MEGGKIAGLYDLERTLGRGHFAVVKLARHVFTGEKVAVKVIDKSKLDAAATAHLFQEVRCMKLVQHPNVVRLYEVIDTQTKLYLILELGDGGDMYDYIMRHEGGLSEETAKQYFAQIVHAISYCHQLHVVHRDLKPENVVFFEEQGLVKLTDFGFSNLFQPGTKLATSCGSLAYSAPEILLGDEYDAPAVDVWSLGVILYMLVCGHAPFQEANDSETLTMIMDCKYTVPGRVSQACGDLIARMLQREPKRRAMLDDVASHPWLCGIDPSPALKLTTPLVSHKSLSDDEHSSIVQRMVLGNIAEREEIIEALEANRYNHITATYFLLAERVLKDKMEKQLHSQRLSGSSTLSKVQYRQSWPARIHVTQEIQELSPPTVLQPATVALPSPSGPSPGSLFTETEPTGLGELGALQGDVVDGCLCSGSARKTVLFTLGTFEEDAGTPDAEEMLASGTSLPSSTPIILRARASTTNRLTSRKSAPLLNQISEEAEDGGESDEELGRALPPKLSRLRLSLASPAPVHRRYARGTRRSHGPPGRASSCSSSETSDDDQNNNTSTGAATGGTAEKEHRGDGPPGSGGGGLGPSGRRGDSDDQGGEKRGSNEGRGGNVGEAGDAFGAGGGGGSGGGAVWSSCRNIPSTGCRKGCLGMMETPSASSERSDDIARQKAAEHRGRRFSEGEACLDSVPTCAKLAGVTGSKGGATSTGMQGISKTWRNEGPLRRCSSESSLLDLESCAMAAGAALREGLKQGLLRRLGLWENADGSSSTAPCEGLVCGYVTCCQVV
uniref:SNF-related serine/threonine-protein kinase n=1 Tax=Eptatretus burgeri TaxID=7764 RepID=A0A8C4QE57_EPTBU